MKTWIYWKKMKYLLSYLKQYKTLLLNLSNNRKNSKLNFRACKVAEIELEKLLPIEIVIDSIKRGTQHPQS
jgi:hypothetical protein